jgi:predicted  nucleic acid-binding Zn-ribbon protein
MENSFYGKNEYSKLYEDAVTAAANRKIRAAKRKIRTAESEITAAKSEITAAESKITAAESKITAAESKKKAAEREIRAAKHGRGRNAKPDTSHQCLVHPKQHRLLTSPKRISSAKKGTDRRRRPESV